MNLAALIPCLASATLAAPQELPVLEARSRVLDVLDGRHLFRGLWTVDPTVTLDVYHAKRCSERKTVTFVSDRGSLSFDVEPGSEHDFVVRLASGEECRTRLSAQRKPYRRAAERSDPAAPDVIPFWFEDGWIHVEARVNGSEPLDLMFDTGADNLVLHPSALAKGARLELDGSMHNAGLGGTATRRTSSGNRLEVAGLTFEHELALLIEGQPSGYDGILGYVAFEDQVLEIDVDRRELRVHDALPESAAGFAHLAFRYQGTLLAVEAEVDAGGRRGAGWFLLDTGSSATLHVSRALAEELGVDELDALGRSRSRGVGPSVLRNRIVSLPRFSLGGHVLENVPAHVEEPGQEPGVSSGNLLGMQVLERFHVFVDFDHDRVLLSPAARFGEPFEVGSIPWRAFYLAGVVAGALAAGALALRSRRRRRS